MFKKEIVLILLSILNLNSCNRSSNQSLVSDDTSNSILNESNSNYSTKKEIVSPKRNRTSKDERSINPCYYSQLLSNLTGSTNFNEVFRLLENHELTRVNPGEAVYECKPECNNLNLNAVYESLLARKLYESQKFNEAAAKVMTKILYSLQTQLSPTEPDTKVYKTTNNANTKGSAAEKPAPSHPPDSLDEDDLEAESFKILSAKQIKSLQPKEAFNYSVNRWIYGKSHELPVLPVKKFYRDNKAKFASKNLALRYALGLDANGNLDLNAKANPAFQFSFLMSNAKGNDQIGIPKWYRFERSIFFSSYLRKIRGFRADKPPHERNVYRTQYGIATFDVPQLEAPKGTRPWLHWGRDICINQPVLSRYGKSVIRLQIPVACGVSGSTHIALWSVFASRVELNTQEMQTFLLLTWSLLSLDGGHTLQEVLTTAKVLSDYLMLMDSKSEFHHKISPVTLASLHSATADVVAVDYDLLKRDDNYLKQIESGILAEKSGPYYINYWKDDQEVLSEQEIKINKEIQYYFSDRGRSVTGTKFGQYADGFFKYIQTDLFTQIKKQARDELLQYHKASCSVSPK